MRKRILLIPVLALVLLMLEPVPVGAYSDHFTSDTSANYGPNAYHWQWQTGGNGFVMPYNNTHMEYYDVEKFGSGTYNWTGITWVDANPQPWGIYGASALDDGNVQSLGTHYGVLIYNHQGVYLRKYIAGAETTIGSYVAEIGNGPYNLSVVWDQDTGSHHVYLNDVLRIDVTDTGITDDGYMGMGINVWNWFKVDQMSFTPSETPTPTPTPTPTVTSTVTFRPPSLDSIPPNTTCKKGETWIRCNWSWTNNITSFVIDDQAVFLNGTLYSLNYSQYYIDGGTKFYYLSLPDRNSNSLEIMEVWFKNYTYDNYTFREITQIKTHPGSTWWYMVLGLGTLIVGYFVPVFGFLSMALFGMGYYMAKDLTSQGFIVVTYAICFVLSMSITAWRLYR